MALHEDCVRDHEFGRFMDHDLAECDLAVKADFGDTVYHATGKRIRELRPPIPGSAPVSRAALGVSPKAFCADVSGRDALKSLRDAGAPRNARLANKK